MQVLNLVLAGINQKMSGKPPFIKSAETSDPCKEIPVYRVFRSGDHRYGGDDREPARGGERECGAPAERRTQEAVHHPHHPHRLGPVEHPVPVYPRGAVHGGDVAGELRCVPHPPGDQCLAPVFVALAVFAFVGLGMVLTRVAKEAESAAAAADALMFPMMFLSGTFFPVEMMPEFLQKFAKVLPLYYVNEGLRAAMVSADHMAALRYARS